MVNIKGDLKMADCNHDCESCSSNCGERTVPFDFTEKLNEYSSVKTVSYTHLDVYKRQDIRESFIYEKSDNCA